MADLCVEFAYVYMCGSERGRGSESVSYDELFGDFSEVGYHDRDVTLLDKVFCRGVLPRSFRFCRTGAHRAAGGN